MSKKKKHISKNRTIKAQSSKAFTSVGFEQLERISKYPLQIKGNMVVLDDLERGTLSIYEPDTDGPVYVQYLDQHYIKGATLVGHLSISIVTEEKGILITELNCEEGHEDLAKPMMDHVQHFVDFYDQFEKMGLEDSVYRKWILKEE